MRRKINKGLVLAEIILLLASVFIFRGLWLLLDSFEIMYNNLALWVSLLVGIAVAIPALRYIIKYNK